MHVSTVSSIVSSTLRKYRHLSRTDTEREAAVILLRTASAMTIYGVTSPEVLQYYNYTYTRAINTNSKIIRSYKRESFNVCNSY
jgi:hypothetical protein